jgi:signal transduction histidine kinase
MVQWALVNMIGSRRPLPAAAARYHAAMVDVPHAAPDALPAVSGGGVWPARLDAAVAALVAAAASATVEEVLVQQMATLFEGRRAVVALIDRDLGALRTVAQVAEQGVAVVPAVLIGEGLMGWVFETGRPLRLDDYDTSDMALVTMPRGILGAAMSAPIPSGRDHLHGVVAVAAPLGGRRYDDADLTNLTLLARIAGVVLDASRARRQHEVAHADRLAALEREQAANAAKTEFLARIGHELRTPLNAIYGFAQLLELELRDTAHAEQIDHVLQASRHLRDMLDDVNDIALIERGKVTVSLHTIPVTELLAPVVPIMRADAERNGRVFTVDEGDAGDALVRADPSRARQVLINLASNAVKYNRPGGIVHLFCKRNPAAVEIGVQDTGRGIPPTDLERIFRPFVRLPEGVRQASGSGLGLTLARGLADAMEAQLKARSREGIGSVFTLELPLATSGVRAEGVAS